MYTVSTAGEIVAVECASSRLLARLRAATGGELAGAGAGAAAAGAAPTVLLRVLDGRPPLARAGWAPVARGVWARPGRVLLADACGSGFDIVASAGAEVLEITAWYRPLPRVRAANIALAARFRQLAAQTLVHYPALWRAALRGRVPLHVSVTAGAQGVMMIAGPGGVGKSTLVAAALAAGDTVTADNVCACDGRRAYGLAEPLRLDDRAMSIAGLPGTPGGARAGALAPHGRREYPLPRRADCLEPDRIVVLRRGDAPALAPLPPATAARELIAGTYMAGELRRFWQFAAALAEAGGEGPAHPDVAGVAAALSARLPCLALTLGQRGTAPARELLAMAGAA